MHQYVRRVRVGGWLGAGLAVMAWCAMAMATPPTTPEVVRDGRCDHCGGGDRVRTVCVKRMTERKITKVCWGYRCEEVCIPGPSIFCGTRHHRDDCGCWTCRLWKPTCAEVITRHVPEKKEITRTVPAVAWTVEERCCLCRHDRAPTDRVEPGESPGGTTPESTPKPR